MTGGDRTWVRGLKGLAASIVALLAIYWVADASFDIPDEFAPLRGFVPTIFFTTIGALGATGVFGIVRKRAARPERLFRMIAGGVLLLSFVPDVLLLGDGAGDAFPGATPAGVGTLMVMHVVAAAIMVGFLTAGDPGEEPPSSVGLD